MHGLGGREELVGKRDIAFPIVLNYWRYNSLDIKTFFLNICVTSLARFSMTVLLGSLRFREAQPINRTEQNVYISCSIYVFIYIINLGFPILFPICFVFIVLRYYLFLMFKLYIFPMYGFHRELLQINLNVFTFIPKPLAMG